MSAIRLADIRKDRGLTQAQLAEMLGVTQQTIYYYESGERDIKASVLQELSRALDCTISDILGLSDEFAREEFIKIPLCGDIAAGVPIEAYEWISDVSIPMQIKQRHPKAFCMRVQGKSMNRVLPNGCYAVIDPSRTEVLHNGTAFAVCVNGFTATIKRINKLANGFELVPDSTDPTFRPRVYDYNDEDTEEITIIGEVVWYTLPYDFEI